MKIAYVSGKYRGPSPSAIVRNIRAAEDVAIELWKMGYAVICPHKNTSLLDGLCPDDVWLKGDLAILRKCDVVVAIPGWEESQGAIVEMREAHACNITTRKWPRDKDLLAVEA